MATSLPSPAQVSHRGPSSTMSSSVDLASQEGTTMCLHRQEQEQKWVPKRSLEECERILTAPGSLHEMEHALIDGRILRVYKNLPPHVRAFWLDLSEKFADRQCVVYESERFTYRQIRDRSLKLAAFLYARCAVRKGDRVAILMRNYPDYLVILWASQLLGAITTFVNAWAPPATLKHCINLTEPRVLFVDDERADRLMTGGLLDEMKAQTKLGRVFVVRERRHGRKGMGPRDGKWKWKGMESLEDTLDSYNAPTLVFEETSDSQTSTPSPSTASTSDVSPAASLDPSSAKPVASQTSTALSPKTIHIRDSLHIDSPATIFFTSGTTGLPKGVLSSQRAFVSNIFNAFAGKYRSLLRNGEDLPDASNPSDDEQRCYLLSVPMFHVTGMTSTVMVATALGGKLVLMRKWEKDLAARLILRERVTSAGGVPSMAMDLLESDLLSSSPGILEALAFGGAPSAKTMPEDIRRRFGGNVASGQGYGLSETNAVAVSVQGEDYLARPDSTGLAAPINDLMIVDPHTLRVMPPGEIGEIWIKGSNVMTEYYKDRAATEKAITKDGWFKSGDLATMDKEGFVFIKDRHKDMIIRGGENIHSTEVENALYADERILDAAAVSVPDKRLGELVAAVVATRPHHKGLVTEESVIEHAKTLLPPHAVPVIVLVQDEMIDRNANGKIVKTDLRTWVRKEWARRMKAKTHDAAVAAKGKTKAKAKL